MGEDQGNGDSSQLFQEVRTGLPRWRHTVRAGVLIFICTLLLLEIGLRMSGVTRLVLYEADARAGYRLRPSQDVHLMGNRIVINSWGVRDPRDFSEKDPEAQRILVLGDSVTWGGLKEHQEDLFTSVLERSIPATEVINGGVNGYSVAQMAGLYESRLKGLQPDRIIVIAIARDFTRPPSVRLTGNSVSFPQTPPRFALPAAASIMRFLAYQRFQWDWLKPPPAAVLAGPPLSEDECVNSNIDALELVSNDLGGRARLEVILIPTQPGIPGSDRLDALVARLDIRGIPTVNLADHVEFTPQLYSDGVHLTTEGHAAVGHALARLLLAR